MVLEFINILMEQDMKEIGSLINRVGKEQRHGQMDRNSLELIEMG